MGRAGFGGGGGKLDLPPGDYVTQIADVNVGKGKDPQTGIESERFKWGVDIHVMNAWQRKTLWTGLNFSDARNASSAQFVSKLTKLVKAVQGRIPENAAEAAAWDENSMLGGRFILRLEADPVTGVIEQKYLALPPAPGAPPAAAPQAPPQYAPQYAPPAAPPAAPQPAAPQQAAPQAPQYAAPPAPPQYAPPQPAPGASPQYAAPAPPQYAAPQNAAPPYAAQPAPYAAPAQYAAQPAPGAPLRDPFADADAPVPAGAGAGVAPAEAARVAGPTDDWK